MVAAPLCLTGILIGKMGQASINANRNQEEFTIDYTIPLIYVIMNEIGLWLPGIGKQIWSPIQKTIEFINDNMPSAQ